MQYLADVYDSIRHALPYLELSFNEMVVFLQIVNSFMTSGSLQVPRTLDPPVESGSRTMERIMKRIESLGIVVRAGDQRFLNAYGLMTFYVTLASGGRPVSTARMARFKEAVAVMAVEMRSLGISHSLLTCIPPVLEPRPKRTRRARVVNPGRPTNGEMTLSEKVDLWVACTSTAIRHISTLSELVVFLRCLDMTIWRGKVKEPIGVTQDDVEFGQGGFGSLGIPVSGRRLRAAMKTLRDKGFIVTKKLTGKEPRTTNVVELLGRSKSKTTARAFVLEVNAVGLAALHASRIQTLQSLETFYMAERYATNSVIHDRIDGQSVADLRHQLEIPYHEIAKRILRALDIPDSNISINPDRDWVQGSCILARWTHTDGNDAHHSFGIVLNKTGEILCKCFTCAEPTQSLTWWLQQISNHSGVYPRKAHREMRAAQSLLTHGNVSSLPYSFEAFSIDPLPDTVIASYPRLHHDSSQRFAKACCIYLYNRQIKPVVWEQFKIRFTDYYGPALVFPYTTMDGKIYVLKFRRIYAKKGEQFRFLEGSDCPKRTQVGAFFGTDKVTTDLPLIVVEGEFDALSLTRFGYSNVVACGGTSVTAPQREVLKRFAHIIIGFDADEPGRQSASRLYDCLKFDVPVIRMANWGLIGNGLGDYCKDPAEVRLKSEIDYIFSHLTVMGRLSRVA